MAARMEEIIRSEEHIWVEWSGGRVNPSLGMLDEMQINF